jgi:hypothetical protein
MSLMARSREEPGAGKPHAQICEGAAEWPSYSTATRLSITAHYQKSAGTLIGTGSIAADAPFISVGANMTRRV